MKNSNTNAFCSLYTPGFSVVTVTTVLPNPRMKSELMVLFSPAGILVILPEFSPSSNNKPPSRAMLQFTSIASTVPVFLITALTLNNPPVRDSIGGLALLHRQELQQLFHRHSHYHR